jgi:hypothetical protein
MNRTVYVPEDEAETWEKARKLSNDRLSPVIIGALKEFIRAKEAEAAEAAGFERIEVEFDDAEDNHLPKKKAFRGKWLFSPEEPHRVKGEHGTNAYALAITAKGQVAVFYWAQGQQYSYNHRFHVFPSLESAAEDPDINRAAREAIRTRGVPVEELDI